MLKFSISKHSKIKLYDYELRPDALRIIVCNKHSQKCFLGNLILADFLNIIKPELTLQDIERKLIFKWGYNYYQNRFGDVRKMTRLLIHYGLVEKLDDLCFSSKFRENKVIKSNILRSIIHIFVKIFMIFVFVAGIDIMIKNFTHYYPHSDDFFWGDFSLSYISSFVIGLFFLLFHELGHMYMARNYGLETEFSLGTRYYFLVAQTNIKGVYSVNKLKRLVIYFAGMVVDFFVICVSVILMYMKDMNFVNYNEVIYLILKQVILIQWLSIFWQYFFFLKTDVYYMVTDVLSISFLLEKSQKQIYKFCYKLVGCVKIKELSNFLDKKITNLKYEILGEREKKIVSAYSVFVVIGFIMATMKLFSYFIPVAIKTYSNGLNLINIGIVERDLMKAIRGFLLVSMHFTTLILTLKLIIRKSDETKID